MLTTLLGTGCPPADPHRFGPAALIRNSDSRLLVDCGSGVSQRLVSAGCPGAQIDTLLLTHLHSDHLVDLYQLIVSSWHGGRDRPQRVFGPPGTRQFVEATLALWDRERAQRIAHERRPSTAALEVEVEEISGGMTLDFDSIKVDVVDVNHQPVEHAFGFVFRSANAQVAISGDTTWCPALIDAAKGVDLLVHEVFMHHEMKVVPGVRTQQGVDNVGSYHTLSDVVGKVAHAAQARCLMLTHFVPPRFDRRRLLGQVRVDYAGPILIGEDLMSFDACTRDVSYGDVVATLGG